MNETLDQMDGGKPVLAHHMLDLIIGHIAQEHGTTITPEHAAFLLLMSAVRDGALPVCVPQDEQEGGPRTVTLDEAARLFVDMVIEHRENNHAKRQEH